MPKFVKVTNTEDGGKWSSYIECSRIIYLERNSKDTQTAIIIQNIPTPIYIKETPETLLKLIAECED